MKLLERFDFAIDALDKGIISDWEIISEEIGGRPWCISCAKKYGVFVMPLACIHGMPDHMNGYFETRIILKSYIGNQVTPLTFKMPSGFEETQAYSDILEMKDDRERMRAILLAWKERYREMTITATI